MDIPAAKGCNWNQGWHSHQRVVRTFCAISLKFFLHLPYLGVGSRPDIRVRLCATCWLILGQKAWNCQVVQVESAREKRYAWQLRKSTGMKDVNG